MASCRPIQRWGLACSPRALCASEEFAPRVQRALPSGPRAPSSPNPNPNPSPCLRPGDSVTAIFPLHASKSVSSRADAQRQLPGRQERACGACGVQRWEGFTEWRGSA